MSVILLIFPGGIVLVVKKNGSKKKTKKIVLILLHFLTGNSRFFAGLGDKRITGLFFVIDFRNDFFH